MKNNLHIDIETFCELDLKTVGVYKYTSHPSFEILLIAFKFNDEEVKVIDLVQRLPTDDENFQLFECLMLDPDVVKYAHNAIFERLAFRSLFDTEPSEWRCSAIKSAYCGYPMALGEVSKAMSLDSGKLDTGKSLIKLFCMPRKPTKNNITTRNWPDAFPTEWESFKEYVKRDVEAEVEIMDKLSIFDLPVFEHETYSLDQKINDRGILIDIPLAVKAIGMDEEFSATLSKRTIELTGVSNPNSAAQLKKWLSSQLGQEVTSLNKEDVPNLLKVARGDAKEVLEIRKKAAKSSIKKYAAMLNCVGGDSRARGLFQFYGASRTGRWAGRLIQLQNLPRNYIGGSELEDLRADVREGLYDSVLCNYGDISSMLSQLIRTAFIPTRGKSFVVVDFSAIEARVIAWLASEQWRLDVFNTHGKIYEASASMMFNIPLETITKGSPYRAKGKVAELALGYQGGLEALRRMGGEKEGLSDDEMSEIVRAWRQANPRIVSMWYEVEENAKKAIKSPNRVFKCLKGLEFLYQHKVLTIKLPSGRKLFYQNPCFTTNRFGKESIRFRGMNQETKVWGWVETYGGKLVENIIQAIARDILADSMLRLDRLGYDIVMHVHDEIVMEVRDKHAEQALKDVSDELGQEVAWARGLPLKAEGFICNFYQKD